MWRTSNYLHRHLRAFFVSIAMDEEGNEEDKDNNNVDK